MRFIILGNVIAYTSGQQTPEYVGERKRKQSAAAKGINRPYSRPSEDEVHETKSKRGDKSFLIVGTAFLENGTGIEDNNVDCYR